MNLQFASSGTSSIICTWLRSQGEVRKVQWTATACSIGSTHQSRHPLVLRSDERPQPALVLSPSGSVGASNPLEAPDNIVRTVGHRRMRGARLDAYPN